MTAIENIELKGITLKLFSSIIISTITIVSGGFMAYYGLKSDIKDVKTLNEIRKVELTALKSQVDAIQLQVNELRRIQLNK